METQLLRDQQEFPTKEVLEKALGNSYLVFDGMIKTITDPTFGLIPEWNYYKDGKAWLCKVCYKKKTIFWLSIWDKYFKTGFYFTEKNCSGIYELDIDEKLKESFRQAKHIGKLIPLAISINSEEQVKDLLKIVEYKKKLK